MLIVIVNLINTYIITIKITIFSSNNQLFHLFVQKLVSITNDRILFFETIDLRAFMKRRLYKFINVLNKSS